MKYIILSICTILMACMSSLQAQEIKKYEINIGNFNKLQITDNINVTYRCNSDSAGMVTFSATEDEMRSLLFSNKHSTLKIQISTDNALSALSMPHLTVYSDSIKELENEGDSTLYVYDISSPGKVKLKLTDNGKIIARNIVAKEVEGKIFTGQGLISISGKCDKAKLRCTGTGKIEAYALDAATVECMVLGTGHIECNVNGGRLVTKGSGPGRIYYKGTPSEIKSFHLGKLKIIPANDGNQESNTKSESSSDGPTEYIRI